jgi:hypothetical protein
VPIQTRATPNQPEIIVFLTFWAIHEHLTPTREGSIIQIIPPATNPNLHGTHTVIYEGEGDLLNISTYLQGTPFI